MLSTSQLSPWKFTMSINEVLMTLHSFSCCYSSSPTSTPLSKACSQLNKYMPYELVCLESYYKTKMVSKINDKCHLLHCLLCIALYGHHKSFNIHDTSFLVVAPFGCPLDLYSVHIFTRGVNCACMTYVVPFFGVFLGMHLSVES